MQLTILIVDDKPENLLPLRTLLELHNYSVDTALSGEEALKKILQTNYALIILDVQMPGMDGFEVAEAISGSSRAKDIPLIFLSAVVTEKRFIAKGYNSGAIDYLTKPVDPHILLLKVQTFCRLYAQTKELNDIQKALQQEIEIRKAAQNNLNDKLQQLQLNLESMPQIAFTLTEKGNIEYVNERWYSYAENGNTFHIIHEDDKPGAWKEAIANKQEFSAELRLKNPAIGEYRYHLLKIIPVILNGELKNWVGTFTDIDEQKRTHEILEEKIEERTKKLREINRELAASNHDLEQFAYVTSHDLKEPLRKIQVFGSLITERLSPGNVEEVVSYADRIVGSSKKMSNLINDLLHYSRLSKTDDFVITDMNRLLSSVLDDLDISIKESGAQIKVPHIPEMEVIPGQMRQVFQNLISNALKFAKPGTKPSIKITAECVQEMTITSPISHDGYYCRITIKDNGIGFDQKYAEKIFIIFQRLNSYDKYQGTGIGLAIVHKVIDKHHGIIQAQSRPGEGAEFTMVIPVRRNAVKS